MARNSKNQLASAQIDGLAIGKMLDLTLVSALTVTQHRLIGRGYPNLGKRPYSAYVVTVSVGKYHSNGLGCDSGHNLVQSGNTGAGIDQYGPVIALNQIEVLVISTVSVTYPGMLVQLAEHHLIVLINHFAAKVTAVHITLLSRYRPGNKANQNCCKRYFFHNR